MTTTYGKNAESPDEPVDPQDAAEADEQPEVAALKEQLLRLAADYDNFRKRSKREQDDLRRFGVESVLKDILPIVDNFDRALAHAHDSQDPVITGVRMVVRQFHEVMNQYHVRPFESVGKPFDPARHEAVGQEPSNDIPAGNVLRELATGYTIHDRLLRPARVMVAMAPEGKQ